MPSAANKFEVVSERTMKNADWCLCLLVNRAEVTYKWALVRQGRDERQMIDVSEQTALALTLEHKGRG